VPKALQKQLQMPAGHEREFIAGLCRALLPVGALDDLELACDPTPSVDLDELRAALAKTPHILGDLYEQTISRDFRHPNGQFFTPPKVAEFMVGALDLRSGESLLDCACGAGALLLPAPADARLYGMDLDPLCVALTRTALHAAGHDGTIAVGNFLAGAIGGEWNLPVEGFDAIVSNPPYIRHHLLEGKPQLVSHFSKRFGVKLSGLSGSYVHFMLEASERLNPDGRMVFITPSEFLDTSYGRALKQALLGYLRIDEVMLFDQSESEFGETLTTSCITVMSRRTPTTTRFTEAKSMGGAVDVVDETVIPQDELDPLLKWTFYFGERGADYHRAEKLSKHRLGEVGKVRRGIASGNNSFFFINQARVDEWGIEPEFLVPALTAQRDLNGAEVFTKADWEALRLNGRPCWLLWCHRDRSELVGTNALRYIEMGEETGVSLRYLCKVRPRWWSVENVEPPDIIVSYMNRNGVKFVENRAGVRIGTNFLNLWARSWSVERILAALRTPETRAALDTVSRVYGGGLAKIEPNDLSQIPLVETSDAEVVEIS